MVVTLCLNNDFVGLNLIELLTILVTLVYSYSFDDFSYSSQSFQTSFGLILFGF